MISYIVATLPWTLGCLALSPNNAKAVKYRKYLAGSFFGTLVPLIYFFIQHKVHRIPGGKNSRHHSSQTELTRIDSLYYIRFLWVGFDFVWCWIWCSHSSWLWDFRNCYQRCEGCEQGVRPLASKIDGVFYVKCMIWTFPEFFGVQKLHSSIRCCPRKGVCDLWSTLAILALIIRRNRKKGHQVFGQAFSWGDAIDAAADVYNGVSWVGSNIRGKY